MKSPSRKRFDLNKHRLFSAVNFSPAWTQITELYNCNFIDLIHLGFFFVVGKEF